MWKKLIHINVFLELAIIQIACHIIFLFFLKKEVKEVMSTYLSLGSSSKGGGKKRFGENI